MAPNNQSESNAARVALRSTAEDMALKQATDFTWEATDEPHFSRRRAILAKYPQIRELFGVDHSTKYKVTLVVIAQILAAFLVKDLSWTAVVLLGWSFGGFANQFLNLAVHEITHNLAFEKPLYNRLFAIFIANPPLAIPSAVTFQKYHMEHHIYQGVEGIDMDIPTKWEGRTFDSNAKKLIWVFFQPLFYILRPISVKPKPFGVWELINWVNAITFNFLVVYFWGWKSLVYLLCASLLAMGYHPIAGHFIAEHYIFAKGYETYSYYGPLNALTLNVGYHNEHHDFPRIPGSRLPRLRKIAPEFYENLPHHYSWVKVIWEYIVDPTVGPYSRVMRKSSKHNKLD